MKLAVIGGGAAVALAAAILTAAAVAIARIERAATALSHACAEADAPVPYWLTAEAEALAARTDHALLLAALCNPCNNGTGKCLCTVQCGHRECIGGFTDEDLVWLQELTMPEGTDQ